MTGTSFFPVPSSALRWDNTGRIHQQSRAVSMGKSFKYFPLTLPESCCLRTPEPPSIILPISIVLLDLSVPLSMTGVPPLQQGLQGTAPSQSSLFAKWLPIQHELLNIATITPCFRNKTDISAHARQLLQQVSPSHHTKDCNSNNYKHIYMK